MFDTELYQQVLGLTAPWKVTDVRLDVESTEIHVQAEHPEGCRWNCPHCSRELACYDHAPERQWRHLTPASSIRWSMPVSHGSSARSTEWCRSRCRERSPTAASPCSWSDS